ncbi:hypothetical protein GCM10027408_04010 [Microbacterium tumbae]
MPMLSSSRRAQTTRSIRLTLSSARPISRARASTRRLQVGPLPAVSGKTRVREGASRSFPDALRRDVREDANAGGRHPQQPGRAVLAVVPEDDRARSGSIPIESISIEGGNR